MEEENCFKTILSSDASGLAPHGLLESPGPPQGHPRAPQDPRRINVWPGGPRRFFWRRRAENFLKIHKIRAEFHKINLKLEEI